MSSVIFVAGNKRTLYLGVQADKDTPQNTPTVAMRVQDVTPDPVRDFITLAETDRTTQEPGQAVIGLSPSLSFKSYLRPSQVQFLMTAILGDPSRPQEQTDYLSVFEDEPDTWCNQYTGLRLTDLELTGQVGGAIEATVKAQAIGFLAGVTSPGSPDAGSDMPYVYPNMAISRGGVHPGTASQFQLSFSRNSKRAQGDNGMSSLDIVHGLWSCSGQITKYAGDDQDQRQVDTGAVDGTSPTTALFTETLEIVATPAVGPVLDILIAEVSYPTRTAAVNTDGSPLAEVLTFRTQPQASLADQVTVTVT